MSERSHSAPAESPLADALFELGCLIDACRWVADALEHATPDSILAAPPKSLHRASGVAHALSCLLEPAASRLFDLCEPLLNQGDHHD